MSNASEMYKLREDMEYQCVCEDSKVRVYVSLVRSEEERQRRALEIRRRNHKKRIIREIIHAGTEVAKLGFSIGIGVGVYSFLSVRLLEARGYAAVGSEVFFAGFVGAGVLFLLNKIFGGDHLLEK